ncbi:hypothetical protein PI125_g27327 [Phytophthora idaei]|nr:hypothetical protein PI125_g27327 [Phytophthora idaei]
MSPADETMDSSNTRADEDEKPRRVLRNLSFSEGRERAQATKAAAEQSKHTYKRHASRSLRREALETKVDPYKNLFASDSEEEEEGAVNEPQEISNDLDRQQEDFQAARRARASYDGVPLARSRRLACSRRRSATPARVLASRA